MKYLSIILFLFFAFETRPMKANTAECLIVVELFSSQGCDACPVADSYLTALAKNKNVLALGFHVDYWDYLGWKDIFAQPEFGVRQEFYNLHIKNRVRRVTPQMIFNGIEEVSGADGAALKKIKEVMKKITNKPFVAQIKLHQNDDLIFITLEKSVMDYKDTDIYLVNYTLSEKTKITRGDNAGKKFIYTNIVNSLRDIGDWNMAETYEFEYRLPKPGHYALIVQAKNHGPIYGAHKITYQ